MDLVKKQKHVVHGDLCSHRSYRPKAEKRIATRTYKPTYLQPTKVACMDIWSSNSTPSKVKQVHTNKISQPTEKPTVSAVAQGSKLRSPVARSIDMVSAPQRRNPSGALKRDSPQNKVVNQIQATLAASVAETTIMKDKKPRKLNLSSTLMYGMALIVFVIGLAASIHSFLIDKQVVQSVSAQSSNEARIGDDVVDESEPSDADLRSYTVNPDMPRYVTIPKLSKRAMIKSVGVKADGSLDAPGNVHTAGWYNQSVKPGTPGGAAVLDGHVSGPTVKGVFSGIDKLVAGDVVTVEMGDGRKIDYEVIKLETTKAEDVDMAKLMIAVTPGSHGLNMITCAGKFDSRSNSYPDRTVVYTNYLRTY